METPAGQVTIMSPGAAADRLDRVVGGRAEAPSAVLVAGSDAAAVGEGMAGWRAAGVPAAGWVGDPSDPAVREMAAELFPGCEIVAADG